MEASRLWEMGKVAEVGEGPGWCKGGEHRHSSDHGSR